MKIQESMKVSFFHKYKHGSKFPLQVNWIRSSGLKISAVVGVLSAVGIILVAKDKKVGEFIGTLLATDKLVASPRYYWLAPGLVNNGNNCFLNVVLQALASCSSLRKYLGQIVEEYGLLEVEEGDLNMPLITALTSLVEELGTVRHRRTVLNPRKVMLAMDHYKPNFNLTNQQDAEEALSHLLSSLRQELSENYPPNRSYLADLPELPCGRIITKRSQEESEWQRWRRSFLGPFDGMLGSILICQSCSFQISLDFQLFHSLHLSPPISSNGAIVDGATLDDCLKHFFDAENLENYRCSNCWHNAALKFVSVVACDKTADIEKLQNCSRNDTCDCEKLPSLEAFQWSSRFSRIFKQLRIARSPKILCIHLQRASYNMFGQSVKLQGHLSFPLTLDLCSFINSELRIEKMKKNSQFKPSNEIYKWTIPYPKYQSMQLDLGIPSKACKAESRSSETKSAGVHERNAIIFQNGQGANASEGSSLLNSRRCTNDNVSFSSKASETVPNLLSSGKLCDGNVSVILPSPPLRRHMYRLVSVVEHFGSVGSGHYMVYRRVTAKIGDEDPVALLESAIEQWYCISDSEVRSVSEKDVLDANASMLFYEKINDPTP